MYGFQMRLTISRLQALIQGNVNLNFPTADLELLDGARNCHIFSGPAEAARKNREVSLARIAQREAELTLQINQMESLEQERTNHLAFD